jgi:Na+-transporting methylmalonyl-CoA/oxaloacetate decarboxylase gamma subunit
MNTFQSIAAGLAIAAAACATIPIVGPIIAAVLLLIAAVIILIGQMIDKALEDAAARKEKEAAQKDLEAEEKKRSSDEFGAFALTPICLTAAAVLFVSAVIVVRCRQTKESNA